MNKDDILQVVSVQISDVEGIDIVGSHSVKISAEHCLAEINEHSDCATVRDRQVHVVVRVEIHGCDRGYSFVRREEAPGIVE